MKFLKSILRMLLMFFTFMNVSAAKEVEPFQYALALQKLQDQIVLGNLEAHQAQLKMLRLMSKSFKQARIVDWQERKNAEALLIFLLSGGNPNIAIELLAIKNQPNLPKGVLAGALAFVSGEPKAALKFLEPIVLEGLSTNVAAQIALARASLYAGRDDGSGRAMEQLALVRLLKPGTLLEEAALRRSVAIAGANRDKKAFIRMSRLYSRRFNKSYYRKDFISNFSYYISILDFGFDSKFIEDLEEIMNRLSEENRAAIYITVTRAAMLDGKVQLATILGRKAIIILQKQPLFVAKSNLYLGGTLIVSGKEKEGSDLIDKVDRQLLDVQDQELLDAIILILAEIRKPLITTHSVGEKAMSKITNGKLGESNGMQNSKTVDRAIDLIKGASKILENKTYGPN